MIAEMLLSSMLLFLGKHSIFIHGAIFSIQTYNNQSKVVGPLDNKNIIYEVKGCSNAVIELSSNQNLQLPFYRVTLGADLNTVSKLNRISNSAGSESLYYLPVLDCSQYKPFWIVLDKIRISAGRGNIGGNNVLMTSTDGCPVLVNTVSIKSLTSEILEWKFYSQQSNGPVKRIKKFTKNQKYCLKIKLNILPHARSIVDCTVRCQQNVQCLTFSYKPSGECALYLNE